MAFAAAAPDLARAGWPVLLLPPGRKAPPPDGYTGGNGAVADDDTIARWAVESPGGNVALRLPDGVVGIDVDAYDKGGVRKQGDVSLADLEARHGPLPATWVSTSRPAPSGIRLYRVPGGTKLPGIAGPDIEIIQHAHRYMLVAPSLNPDSGERYCWVTPDGELSDRAPRPDELPSLPSAWIDGLSAPEPERDDRQRLNLDGVRTSDHHLDDESPADEYSRTHTWEELLGGDGWACGSWRGDERYWTRPGKSVRDGHSAVEHRDGPLVVFSADSGLSMLHRVGKPTADGGGWSLSPFHYHAATRHGGDMSAAARSLRPTRMRADGTYPSSYGQATGTSDGTIATDPRPEPRQPEAWGEPVPLVSVEAPPPFPVDALPAWIAEHAVSVAGELQVPVDLPAMLGLGALSIAAAGRLVVHVRSTWKEPMALYLATALPPSSGKSPAFRAMLGPIDEWEAAQIDSAAGRISELDQERRILEKKMKRLEDSDRADEARAARVELEALDTAVLPQVVADDVTPEKLVQILAEQDGRLAIASPEGGIFDMMAGKYSDSSTLDPYLKAWSGDTIKVDRMTRAGAVVRRPVLSIAITVQPSVIEALAANKELRGRGLTARFMYSVPEDLVGRRNLLDAPMADLDAADRYGQHIVAIMRRWWAHPEPHAIPLSAEAAGLFMAWRQELEDQRGPNGPLRHMAEWTTKLESSVARLAGLLAVAGFDTARPPAPGTTIGADEMAAAIVIGDYWLEHGKVVHDLWSADPVAGAARKIMQWAADQPVDNFTVRTVFNALRRTFGAVDNLARPLAMLVDHGWIRLAEGHDGSTGRGKPSPAYDVHPDAVVTFASCSSHVRNSSAYHAYSAPKGSSRDITPLLAEMESEGPPYALSALSALESDGQLTEGPADGVPEDATSAPELSTGESYPQARGADMPDEWGEL